jgi:hypothetical protein
MKRDSNRFLLPGRNKPREFLGMLWSVLTIQLFWKWDYEFWFESQYWHNRKTLLEKLKNGEVELISHTFGVHTVADSEDFKIRIGTEEYMVTAWHLSESLFPPLSMEQMREGPRESLFGIFISSATMRKCNSECYRRLKKLSN